MQNIPGYSGSVNKSQFVGTLIKHREQGRHFRKIQSSLSFPDIFQILVFVKHLENTVTVGVFSDRTGNKYSFVSGPTRDQQDPNPTKMFGTCRIIKGNSSVENNSGGRPENLIRVENKSIYGLENET